MSSLAVLVTVSISVINAVNNYNQNSFQCHPLLKLVMVVVLFSMVKYIFCIKSTCISIYF